jgi:hypothetical protein
MNPESNENNSDVLNLESFKLVREKEANPESQKFEIDLK